MRLTLAMGVLGMLGLAGCSNGSKSTEPSAYYYKWRHDFSTWTWVVYTVSTPEAVKMVDDWIAAHAVELQRAEEVGPGDWIPENFLFEAYPDGSYRDRAVMRAIPNWKKGDKPDKPKGQLEWIPNLSAAAVDELRKIFQDHGQRLEQLPEELWSPADP